MPPGLPTRFFDADVGVVLNFVVLQADGVTPQDLTGATITLKVEDLTGSPLSPVVIDDAANGRCHYVITSGQFPPGVYRAQLRLFYSSTNVIHTDIFQLNASKAIA